MRSVRHFRFPVVSLRKGGAIPWAEMTATASEAEIVTPRKTPFGKIHQRVTSRSP